MEQAVADVSFDAICLTLVAAAAGRMVQDYFTRDTKAAQITDTYPDVQRP